MEKFLGILHKYFPCIFGDNVSFIERTDLRSQKAKHYQDNINPNIWRSIFTVHDQHYFTGLAWEDIDESILDDTALGFNKSCSKTRHVFRCSSAGSYRWQPRRLVPTEYIDITNIQYWVSTGGGRWRNLNLPTAVWKNSGAEWDMSNMYASVTNTWRKIKTSLILKDSTAYNRIRFQISLTGLSLDTNTWALTSIANNVVVGFIEPPFGIDANGVSVPVTASYDGTYIEWDVDVTGVTYPINIDPTFTDGPSGDADTAKDILINSSSAGSPSFHYRNYGNYNPLTIAAGGPNALLQFDLSSIDAAATCNSATLYMYSNASSSANAWVVNVFSIASGNAGWIEGTGNGSTYAASGEPCWDCLAADGSGGVTTPWAGSAGLGTAGTDYESGNIGSLSGDRSDAAGTEYTTSLTTSRVEGWFGASNTNYGLLLLRFSGNSHDLASSDHATPAYHPKLIVDYTVSGGTSISVTDTANGLDTRPSIAASLSNSDIAIGAEQRPSTSVSLGGSDSGFGVDNQSLAASLGMVDGSLGGDFLGLTAGLSLSDNGLGFDSLAQLQAALGISETGTAGDLLNLLASLSINDAGSGSDSINILTTALKQISDSGLGSDQVSISASLSITETATGQEALSIQVSISILDNGTGIDSEIVYKTSITAISIVDLALGSDNLSISASLNIGETSIALDSPDIAASLNLADIGSAFEGPSISATLSIIDTSSATDLISVLSSVIKTISDNASGLDSVSQISASIPLSDTGLGTDQLSQILAALIVTDFGTGVDVAVKYDTTTQIIKISFIIKKPTIEFELKVPKIEFELSIPDIGFSLLSGGS